MNTTELIFRKRRAFIFPSKGTSASKVSAATLAKNVESYGYRFTRRAFNRLATLSKAKLEAVYDELRPILAQSRGSHRKFSPMYPNFPVQVMEMDEFELYFNALVHYWSLLLPQYAKEKRETLEQDIKFDLIDIGSEKDIAVIFKTLLAAKAPLSADDKAVVAWVITTHPQYAIPPKQIPLKENLAVAIGAFYSSGKLDVANSLMARVNSPTDILRVSAALCGGDVCLAENVIFKKMPRAARRFLMAGLEPLVGLAEAMAPRRSQWLRLGESLHPGEFHKIFPNCVAAFSALRADKRIPTYGTRVETAVASGNIQAAISEMASRPGDFIRRLDSLLRLSPADATATWNSLKRVVSDISSRVLLQAYGHFTLRNTNPRIVFPKGSTANAQIIPSLPSLPKALHTRVVKGLRKELLRRYAKLSKLGNVFIEPCMGDYAVPFSQRSAAKALQTIPRGSRLPLTEDFTRLFIWWKNGDTRVDIDLSVVLFNSSWHRHGDISYMNLRGPGICHSGDIVDAPRGACEFIDIDRKAAFAAGARYAIMCVNSFSQQPYKDLPECFAGWMERDNPQAGGIFDARTVKQKFDLTGDTSFAIPVIVDLQDEKVLWCDLALKSRPSFPNNVRANEKSILAVCKGVWDAKKLSLFELFSLHAEARGVIVDSREKADFVFGLGGDITPFNIDEVVAGYL